MTCGIENRPADALFAVFAVFAVFAIFAILAFLDDYPLSGHITSPAGLSASQARCRGAGEIC